MRIAAWVIPLIMMAGWSCSGPGREHVRIAGHIPGAAGSRIVLQEMQVHGVVALDSLIVPGNGRFTFRPRVGEEGFWLLTVPSGRSLPVLLVPGSTVEISGDAADYPRHLTVTGPPETILLAEFLQETWKNEIRADSLENLILQRQDSADFFSLSLRADSLFGVIRSDQRALGTRFVGKHPGSLASLLVLNYAFGTSPLFHPEEDRELFLRVDSALRQNYSSNHHAGYHHKRVTGQ